jgi:hypothetical protein
LSGKPLHHNWYRFYSKLWNLCPTKICAVSPHKIFAERHKTPCQGDGEAAKSLDALLVQMKTSFWPRSVHQPNATLIPTGIPSSKMKTMHKRLHNRIEKQLFEILFSVGVNLQALQHCGDSMSIILTAESKTEWKVSALQDAFMSKSS